MSKNFFQPKHLRSLLLTGYRSYARAQIWRKGPRVFINSIPKAGTHLATTILSEHPQLQHSRLHIEMWDIDANGTKHGSLAQFEPDLKAFRAKLQTIRPGQLATAHLPWRPELLQILHEEEIRPVFMTRAPEAVLESTLHYIKGLRRHFMHRHLVEEFPDDDARRAYLRKGGDPNANAPYYDSLQEAFARYAGWEAAAARGDMLSITFEHLIGSLGGGSDIERREEIRRILSYCGLNDGDEIVSQIDQRSMGKKSVTFRKGSI